MASLRVALGQIDIAWEDKEANQKTCADFVDRVAATSDIIVFPEMTLTGFTMKVAENAEQSTGSTTRQFFLGLAKQARQWIIFGLVEKAKATNKGKNMAYVLDPRGTVAAAYQKIHPFSFGKEDRFYQGGNKLGLFTVKGWKAAVVICYDLRFPGLFEVLAKHKPEVIFVIANWPKARIADWHALLRARALDMQSYVVGVNRIGEGNGLQYSGGSEVYGPDGVLICQALSKEATVVVLEKTAVARRRKVFSSLADKKPGVYSRL